MKTVHLFSILATLLFVSSCADMPGMRDMATGPACNTHVCMVKVTVNGCGNINVDPSTLSVAAGNVNMEIHWDITGAEFTPNGINFKEPSVAAAEFFDPAQLTPTKYRWKNRHTKAGQFGYNVQYKVGNTTCPDFDPIIVNN